MSFETEKQCSHLTNTELSYCVHCSHICWYCLQGMHEILAPLLFVLHCDHQALLHTREQIAVRLEWSTSENISIKYSLDLQLSYWKFLLRCKIRKIFMFPFSYLHENQLFAVYTCMNSENKFHVSEWRTMLYLYLI